MVCYSSGMDNSSSIGVAAFIFNVRFRDGLEGFSQFSSEEMGLLGSAQSSASEIFE